MIKIEDIELMDFQSHKNMAIIPIRTPTSYKLDILTLEKGFELGLVKVKECETSTVNTLIVENKSVTPLLLIEGEEIIGGDQNRIVNSSMLIAPESAMKVPVNCTEQGRWGYKHEFRQSEYIANSHTRFARSSARLYDMDEQAAVWDSISALEDKRQFKSPTQAMSESYDAAKTDLNEFVKSFKLVSGQTGVVVIINGAIKGFEVFLNHEIYSQFHEKILKSYLIDAETSEELFSVNTDYAKSVISSAVNCEYLEKPNIGLEECFEFKNDDGVGTLYTYEDEVLHWSYLIGSYEKNEMPENHTDDVIVEY